MAITVLTSFSNDYFFTLSRTAAEVEKIIIARGHGNAKHDGRPEDDQTCSLLGRRVLGVSLRALADGVLGQLTRKQQTNGRLDLAAGDRRAPVVVRQSRRLGRDAPDPRIRQQKRKI